MKDVRVLRLRGCFPLEPHPRPAAVLLDELDAGFLQGTPKGGEVALVRRALVGFE